MKTLNWYIGKSLLTSTLIALGVLTFVMLSGHFFRAFELLSKGVSPGLLAQFLVCMIPDMLRFTLPLSILVSTVLVFGRMSSDNEISALKASGIGLWQIIAPGLLLSFISSFLCVVISLYISPLCSYEANRLKWTALANAPLTILEPGVFMQLSNECMVRVEGRDEKEFLGVHLIVKDKDGGTIRDVIAKKGRLEVDFEDRQLNIHLTEAILTELHFGEATADVRVNLAAYEIDLPLEYVSSYERKSLLRKTKYLNLDMLFARIRLEKGPGKTLTELLVELHKRLSLSLSPFSFFLLGLPFGIRGKRSELSIGLLICVLMALGFYVFLLLADMLEKRPECHPEWIVWLPNGLYLLGGLMALRRLGKH